MKLSGKLWEYFIEAIIIVCSFSFYSSCFYPLMNSDDALNILMAHHYKLPADFYCWGQDRGGTLIPLISQVFIKIFHLPAIWSVSLSNYFILILGYIGFSSLFRSSFTRIIFAVAWFFPFFRFIDMMRFPIGVEYSLLGLVIYFMKKIRLEENNNSWNHVYLSLVSLIIITGIWVSDLSIVSFSILLFILLIFNFIEKKQINIWKDIIAYFTGTVSVAVIFIVIAKSYSPDKTNRLFGFNTWEIFRTGISRIVELWGEFLNNRTSNITETLFFYLVIILLLILVVLGMSKKIKPELPHKIWSVFFLSDFLIVTAVLFMSHWVYANGLGRWYFVSCYISFTVFVLILAENLEIKFITRLIFRAYLTILIFTGAISTLYTIRYIYPGSLVPKASQSAEFLKLGTIGIIGDYWNSYVYGIADPGQIKATPHDRSSVKNKEQAIETIKRDTLYLIRDRWMDSFPDSLEQFGYKLQKDGNEFRMGGCNVCRYRKALSDSSFRIFGTERMKTGGSVLIYDSIVGHNVIFTAADCDSCKAKCFIYGPFITLDPGEYVARFYIKVRPVNNLVSSVLDVTTNGGMEKLMIRKLNVTDISVFGKYGYIDLDFKSIHKCFDVEFRIYDNKNADFWFDHVNLLEKYHY
ncbi:MAG: hypothetical protein NTW49_03165 [Bacteroidia bacterium]|nr:hypothetical protein [Bacteroidia bacterium]